MTARPGRFVTLEGGEGVGKSTQAARLAARLAGRGVEALVTREPGGSPGAEAIRDVLLKGPERGFRPLAETLLFTAARADHLDATIRPALARGAFVVCDRFTDSTRVYQGVLGGLDAEILAGPGRGVVGATQPDLTLALDLPGEVGLARAAARRTARGEAADRYEGRALDSHRRLRRAFLDIAAAEPDRCVVIAAGAAEDEVERAIWDAVTARGLAPAES